MENSLKTKFRMFFTFAMTILATILVLKLLNWILLSFQKEDMRFILTTGVIIIINYFVV